MEIIFKTVPIQLFWFFKIYPLWKQKKHDGTVRTTNLIFLILIESTFHTEICIQRYCVLSVSCIRFLITFQWFLAAEKHALVLSLAIQINMYFKGPKVYWNKRPSGDTNTWPEAVYVADCTWPLIADGDTDHVTTQITWLVFTRVLTYNLNRLLLEDSSNNIYHTNTLSQQQRLLIYQTVHTTKSFQSAKIQ